MIYLIRCAETNTCKIGFSLNPQKRLSSLQTSNPYPLELIAAFEGTTLDESLLHARFSEYKLNGEWFTYNQEIQDYFDERDELQNMVIQKFKHTDNSLPFFYRKCVQVLGVIHSLSLDEEEVFYSLLMKYKHKLFKLSESNLQVLSRECGVPFLRVNYTISSLIEREFLIEDETSHKINPRFTLGIEKRRDVIVFETCLVFNPLKIELP